MNSPLILPKVIGHRGASGYAPENTLAAIKMAKTLGVSWVELDVCITLDEVAVIHHDAELARTTNGEGLVLTSPFDFIQALDAGSWFDTAFSQEPVPTLAQALDLCLHLGLGLNLEIKPTQGWEEPTVSVIQEQLLPYSQKLPLLLSSFSLETLALCHEQLPNIPLGYNTDAIPGNWQQKLEAIKAYSLHFFAPLANVERIAAIKQAGYRVLCFTINDKNTAEKLYALGVDAVFSDYPDRLL